MDRDQSGWEGEPCCPLSVRPGTRLGREPTLGGGAGEPSLQPAARGASTPGRSRRVKMRALIVTKRRRPHARPLPGAVRTGSRSCVPAPLASPATRPRVGVGGDGGWWGAAPVPPPKPGRSCPRLCTPFVPRADRCAALIRRTTDGGGDRRSHLLTSNVGAGEGEAGARPWPARWL